MPSSASPTTTVDLNSSQIAVPEKYICPLSLMIMRENVILASDGYHYQKEYFERYLKTKNGLAMSPINPSHQLMGVCFPDHQLKAEIDTFLEENPSLFQDNSENTIYLPEEFWKEIFEAIVKNNVSRFKDLVRHDTRLLKMTPLEGYKKGLTLITSNERLLSDEPVIDFAIRHEALDIFNCIRALSNEEAVSSFDEYFELQNYNVAYETTDEINQLKKDMKLFSACKHGDLSEANNALTEGANVNADSRHLSYGPLFMATKHRHYDLVELLLQKGALTHTSGHSMHPMHLAAQNNDVKIMALLKVHGANLEETTDERLTPLHFAARSGAIEAVKFLITNGVSVNRKSWNDQSTHYNQTALLSACLAESNYFIKYRKIDKEGDRSEIVQQLIDSGALIRNSEPLKHAQSNTTVQIILKQMQINCISLNNINNISTCCYTPEKLELLLKQDMDPKFDTALFEHVLLITRNIKMLELIFKYGGCPNLISTGCNHVSTLLDLALAKWRDPDAIRILLLNGCTAILSNDTAHCLPFSLSDKEKFINPIAHKLGISITVVTPEEAREIELRAKNIVLTPNLTVKQDSNATQPARHRMFSSLPPEQQESSTLPNPSAKRK